MKLQQLRYFVEINNQQLNISRASHALSTSQSGVSKQIKLLEQELGVHLFIRHGKKLAAITPIGEQILHLAQNILDKTHHIKQLTHNVSHQKKSLLIATTHTQARYVLPVIVEKFMSLYPEINLNIQQGTPEQVAALLEQGDVDIAIATEVLAHRKNLVSLPCYQWSRSIITQIKHPLNKINNPTLSDIVQYPIVTYVQGFTGRYKQDESFNRQHLQPNIVLTAVDADVIKTYVRLGLGIGIIADMAFNFSHDNDLSIINAEHLFGISTSQIAIKKQSYIKPYLYSFIEMFAPHLTQGLIQQAINCVDFQMRKNLFANVDLPMWSPQNKP